MNITYKKLNYNDSIYAIDFAYSEMVSNQQIVDNFKNKLMFTKLNLAKVNDKQLTVYAAFSNNKIVGVIGYEKDFIDFLFVSKKYQNNKIATNLVNCLLKDVLKNGVKTIRLDSTKEGYEFYKKLMFVDDLDKSSTKYIPMMLDVENFKTK